MLKFMKSPLGITLTAAGAILLLSPEARKMTRRVAVKGTATVLGMVDQVRDATTGMRKQLASVMDEARQEKALPAAMDQSTHPFAESDLSPPVTQPTLKDSYNVLNDDLIKKTYAPTHPVD